MRNRFHATLRILSPEIYKQCLRVKNCKARARAEKATKLKNEIQMHKSKHWFLSVLFWLSSGDFISGSAIVLF